MNTLRNFAALALLAFAAISPALQAAEGAGSQWKELRKLLKDKPEVAALVAGGNEKAITDAVNDYVVEHPSIGGQDITSLDRDGKEKAIIDAVNDYVSKHPLKDGQGVADLARDGKEKAIVDALKVRFGKDP